MAMGPLAVGDLAGLDIGYKAREQLSDEEKGPLVNYLLADRLVEAGRLGQKSGSGYYRYDAATRGREEATAKCTTYRLKRMVLTASNRKGKNRINWTGGRADSISSRNIVFKR